MGLVLRKYDTYDFEYGDTVIHFKKNVPVYGLPHIVEDFLFHCGYFNCIYDKYDLPFLDEEENVYKALDYKGEFKIAETQDWAAIAKCNYIQTDFGAPLCSYGGGNRKTCTACLTEDRTCRYPNDSAAHILKDGNWAVMGGKQIGDYIKSRREQ